MKLFENAGFWSGRPAALIAVALMVSAARADGGYEQSGKNITVTGDVTITGNVSGISSGKADRLRLIRSGNSLLLQVNEVGTLLLFG